MPDDFHAEDEGRTPVGLAIDSARAFNEIIDNSKTKAINYDERTQTRALDVLERSFSDPSVDRVEAWETARDLVELSALRERHKFDDLLPELLKKSDFRKYVIEDLKDWSADARRSYDKPQAGALAYFDLDNFKRINDTYGHAVGDEVLKAFAKSLKEAMRHQDRLGRMGGEEVAVWFRGSSSEALEDEFWRRGVDGTDEGIFMRINRLFHNNLQPILAKYNMTWQPLYVDGCPTYFSSGLATIDSISVPGYNLDELYKCLYDDADKMMYSEKRRRKEERSNALS